MVPPAPHSAAPLDIATILTRPGLRFLSFYQNKNRIVIADGKYRRATEISKYSITAKAIKNVENSVLPHMYDVVET